MSENWAIEYWDGIEWGLLRRDPWNNRSLTEKQAKAEADDIRSRGVEARAVPADYDPQCTSVADVEYGRELRCGMEAGHDGECKP